MSELCPDPPDKRPQDGPKSAHIGRFGATKPTIYGSFGASRGRAPPESLLRLLEVPAKVPTKAAKSNEGLSEAEMSVTGNASQDFGKVIDQLPHPMA